MKHDDEEIYALGSEYNDDSGGERSDDDISASDLVRVVIRCRPLKPPKEKDGSSEITLLPDGKSIRLVLKGSKRSYKFFCVADPSRNQEYMFRKTGKHIVDCALSGFNGAIVAYGQTGSGKTYTMQGPGLGKGESPSNEAKGVIQKVCEKIFSHKSEEEASSPSITYLISAEYLEIYNETVIDLLDTDTSKSGSPRGKRKTKKVGIYEDSKGKINVQNQTTAVVNSPEDCYKCLQEGGTRRSVGATNMNSESSRSHAIFTLKIEKNDDVKGIKRTSKLHLVDLAGSERQKGTGSTGLRLKEAGGINKSLSALGNVINALAEREGARQRGEKPGRIPSYRDSKLTFLLKDSFGGNSKLCVIATISPAAGYVDETANTLEFAKRCCSVRNEAVVNEHLSEDIAKLQSEVRRLEHSNKQLKVSLTKARNIEVELRASANIVQNVSVPIRTGSLRPIRKKETKDIGVQTEDRISPFNEGKDVLRTVKTKDLTSALDSLVEGKLEQEDKESRTEKLCMLLTNAISRERFHHRNGEEMKRKVADSHRRWLEMLTKNEELVTSLKERDKTVEEVLNADLNQLERSRSRRIEKEMELMRVQVASNPEIILLRHRVAALESELNKPNANGRLSTEARAIFDGKLKDAEARWMDMLNVNEDLVSSLRKAQDELSAIRHQGLENVYGSEGRKLKSELERMRKESKKDAEKQVLQNRVKALEKELVEFAEISLAAQKEAIAQGTPRGGVANDFTTEMDDFDTDIGGSSDDEAFDLENNPRHANCSSRVKKSDRRPRSPASKQNECFRKNGGSQKLVTIAEAWAAGLRVAKCTEVDEIAIEELAYRPRKSQTDDGNVPQSLRHLHESIQGLEHFLSSV